MSTPFPDKFTPTVCTAHLYGGPLDGRHTTVGIHTDAYADEASQSIYTYCPQASEHFQKNTFIHTSIHHATFQN